MVYVYCEGAEVISYNKTNLDKLLNGKRDVSWVSTVSESTLEETFRQALYDAGILNYPQYQSLAPTRCYRVDYMIPTPNGGMLAVECDGLQYHAKPTAYMRDRQRDNLFLQQGITPVRFCTTDINNHLSECIQTIESLFRNYQTGRQVYHRNCRISYFDSTR